MIVVNIDKAKAIAHNLRRASRTEEFKPLDVKVTIPNEASSAEAERQTIRNKYAVMQDQINIAQTIEQIKAAMPQS